MTNIYIDVFTFSDDPWGRSIEENPDSSGEVFRNKILRDAFRNNDTVIVDFSKLSSIPDSAFLGGAFVGLVKFDGFSYDEILQKLVILPNDGYYPKLITRILTLAKEEEIKLGMLNG